MTTEQSLAAKLAQARRILRNFVDSIDADIPPAEFKASEKTSPNNSTLHAARKFLAE